MSMIDPCRIENISTIVVALEYSPTIFVSAQEYQGSLQLNKVLTAHPSWPLWHTLPDLLVHSSSSTLVGISCLIPENSRELVKMLCTHLSPRVARYSSPATPGWRAPYGEDQNHYFEILWADVQADKLDIAQISDVSWFYANGGETKTFTVNENIMRLQLVDGIKPGIHRLVAFGISDLQHILKVYGLGLPEVFCLPPHDLNDVAIE